MKRSPVCLLCGALLLSTLLPACAASQKEATTSGALERVEGVSDSIALFKKKDSTIEQLFASSAGYVVLPTVGEGAFIIGGGHGKGEAFEAGTYVGRVTVSEISIGAQVGGQSYSQVVFFETPLAFARLMRNTFRFSAEVSAIAVDQGVAKNARFKDGVATFVIPKQGLMASAAVGGEKLEFQPAAAP
jgi:lipid-binding SYLF domain-containing protein